MSKISENTNKHSKSNMDNSILDGLLTPNSSVLNAQFNCENSGEKEQQRLYK